MVKYPKPIQNLRDPHYKGYEVIQLRIQDFPVAEVGGKPLEAPTSDAGAWIRQCLRTDLLLEKVPEARPVSYVFDESNLVLLYNW